MEMSMTPNVSPASSGFAPPVTTQPQQQPTYTTAGTIYNPSAVIPIQPPTRRGRTFKWSSHGGHQTENPLFPRTSNFPSYYPVRAHIPMNVQQQYSPLQQNYDRAVNPLARMDEYPEELKVTVDSRQTSGAASAPLPITSPKPKCGRDHLHSDEEDDADDAIQKTLLNTMTVKSLQNLASYPNPNQKDAQKALSRGSRPLSSLSSQPAVSSSTSTSQDKAAPRTLKSPIQLRPTAEPYQSISQTGHSWAASHPIANTRTGDYIRFSQRLEEHKKELREKQEQRLRRERGEPSPEKPVTAADMSECTSFRLPSPASSLMSELHGPALIPSAQNAVPKPLTAGPPGQRQLRSSTFGGTFRALSNNGRTSHYQSDEEQSFVSTQLTLNRMGLDEAPVTPETHPSAPAYHDYAVAHANYYANVYYYAQAQAQAEAQSQVQAYGYNAAQAAGQYSAVGQQEAALMVPPANESFVYQAWRADGSLHGDPNWRDPDPSSRSRFQPGTDRLNHEELQARNEKINKFWFSGVNMLEQRVEAQFGREENRDYGAIGEPVIHHGKRMNEYTYLSIEEVNGTDVPGHSNYMLQIACENVARVIEDVDKKVDDERAEVLSQVEPLEGFPPVDSFTWEEQSVEITG